MFPHMQCRLSRGAPGRCTRAHLGGWLSAALCMVMDATTTALPPMAAVVPSDTADERRDPGAPRRRRRMPLRHALLLKPQMCLTWDRQAYSPAILCYGNSY
jgi:hypothetical protein